MTTSVDLGESLVLAAAGVGLGLKIPMADGVILVTARAQEATLRTQDSDFAGIPEVCFVERPPASRS